MKTIPLTNSEQVIIIDDEDYDRVIALNTNWFVCYDKNDKPFSVRSTKAFFKNLKSGHIRCGARQITLSRFVWNVQNEPSYIIVDHINHNIFDNRKSETRVCNHHQNCMNRSVNITNTSGFKNVMFFKRDKTWFFRIRINGISHTGNGFKTAQLAAEAKDKKLLELHGNFAHLSFPEKFLQRQ
jgi:hypothetical protein